LNVILQDGLVVRSGNHTPTRTALLSWLPSSDDHTPSIALTYDLALFRNGAPVEIPRQLPQPGNVSAVIEWRLKGLQDGHYEWTLRAVDAAYIGSPIATGVFNVGTQTAVEPEDNLPRDYSLAQNYPNPFNPSTIIRYNLPVKSKVTLKVYNILGKEVTTLVNATKEAGVHEIEFTNDGEFSSGVYFYTIKTEGFTDTKKFILIK